MVYDECVQRLAKVWDYIGIEEEQRQERREVIVQHMRGLLTDMVEEEENLKEKMLTSIRENLEKLKVLRMELKLTVALDVRHTHAHTHTHTHTHARTHAHTLACTPTHTQ